MSSNQETKLSLSLLCTADRQILRIRNPDNSSLGVGVQSARHLSCRTGRPLKSMTERGRKLVLAARMLLSRRK
jgi:hypothetical protein